MKKRYSIFLLACFCLPVLGTYSWLYFQKFQIKQSVKRAIASGLPEEALVRLAFTKIQEAALLRWEGVFEFEFNNQIYDVLRQSPKGDSTIYWCWPDQQETELEHHLDDLVKKACNQDPERQDAKDEVADFFEMLYCYPTWRIETNLSRPFQTFSALKSRIEDQFWQSTFLQGPPSPPPQSI